MNTPSPLLNEASRLDRLAGKARETRNSGLLDNISRWRLTRRPTDTVALQDVERIAAWLGARDPESLCSTGQRGYLLIREWGAGFWSDVFQAAAHLFVAAATGRIPIVHWGPHSRFSDDPDSDAFATFFEPISTAAPAQVANKARRYYPERWTGNNLTDDIPGRKGAQPYLPSLLFREEDIVVGCGYG